VKLPYLRVAQSRLSSFAFCVWYMHDLEAYPLYWAQSSRAAELFVEHAAPLLDRITEYLHSGDLAGLATFLEEPSNAIDQKLQAEQADQTLHESSSDSSDDSPGKFDY
jgi:hypothetical protein